MFEEPSNQSTLLDLKTCSNLCADFTRFIVGYRIISDSLSSLIGLIHSVSQENRNPRRS